MNHIFTEADYVSQFVLIENNAHKHHIRSFILTNVKYKLSGEHNTPASIDLTD